MKTKKLAGTKTPAEVKQVMKSFRFHAGQLREIAKSIKGSFRMEVTLKEADGEQLQRLALGYHWSGK